MNQLTFCTLFSKYCLHQNFFLKTDTLWMIQPDIGSNWFSGFRGD